MLGQIEEYNLQQERSFSDGRAELAQFDAAIQEKITWVTEKSVTIQAQEKRNKALIEQFFTRQREGLRQGRKSSRAAYDYYRDMSQTQVVPPQFMDSKQ